MTKGDPEVQERVDRLFDRFEFMIDAEFMLLRSVWEEQDPGLSPEHQTLLLEPVTVMAK